MSFEALADAEYAHNFGMDHDDRPWILSDRDVWYRNPFYTGPVAPHPEDDIYSREDLFFFNAGHAMASCADIKVVEVAARVWDIDDEIPF